MVIDLGRCVGCSACQIACKLENTVGEDSFLSYHEVVTTGEFPQVSYKYIPTMCNHCADAPCVAACPVGALYKRDGLTLHDPERCIGCGACVAACKNGSAMLFVSAKVSQLALLPQGEVEKYRRVRAMVAKMDELGFGNCTNTGACAAECPKNIKLDNIGRMNRHYIAAKCKE